jgi:hypothetical protein
VQAPERAAEDEADSGALVNVADCAREVGGLLLRGNKCILCKSLTGEWTGWRVPSLERDVDDDESPLACAVRCVVVIATPLARAASTVSHEMSCTGKRTPCLTRRDLMTFYRPRALGK